MTLPGKRQRPGDRGSGAVGPEDRSMSVPPDILLVDLGAFLLVGWIAWYFRLFRRP